MAKSLVCRLLGPLPAAPSTTSIIDPAAAPTPPTLPPSFVSFADGDDDGDNSNDARFERPALSLLREPLSSCCSSSAGANRELVLALKDGENTMACACGCSEKRYGLFLGGGRSVEPTIAEAAEVVSIQGHVATLPVEERESRSELGRYFLLPAEILHMCFKSAQFVSSKTLTPSRLYVRVCFTSWLACGSSQPRTTANTRATERALLLQHVACTSKGTTGRLLVPQTGLNQLHRRPRPCLRRRHSARPSRAGASAWLSRCGGCR